MKQAGDFIFKKFSLSLSLPVMATALTAERNMSIIKVPHHSQGDIVLHHELFRPLEDTLAMTQRVVGQQRMLL